MKHLLLLLLLLCAGYGAWHVTSEPNRSAFTRLLWRHGARLGALVLAIVVLLALAYYATSTRIL